MFDLTGVRQKMPISTQFNFLDHAKGGAISGPAAEAMRAYVDRVVMNGSWDVDCEAECHSTRSVLARLIHADLEEVTFVKNTSEGISQIANGLHFSQSDNIVTTGSEFPSNIYPWMNLQSFGVRLKIVPEDTGRIDVGRLVESIDSRTRLVAVSAVQWSSGFRMDLRALGRACQDKGVLLAVDAIQALGCVPIDVREMNIDFLSSGAHKWLLGPKGIGMFYCRRELQGHLRPTSVGWRSMKQPVGSGRYQFEFRDDATRYDSGNFNEVGIAGLGASARLISEIGVSEIWEHVRDLSTRMVDRLRERGYRVYSPRGPGEESGIVSFGSDTLDSATIQQHLRAEHRTIISLCCGRLRASPHFYNTVEEIDQMVQHLPVPN